MSAPGSRQSARCGIKRSSTSITSSYSTSGTVTAWARHGGRTGHGHCPPQHSSLTSHAQRAAPQHCPAGPSTRACPPPSCQGPSPGWGPLLSPSARTSLGCSLPPDIQSPPSCELSCFRVIWGWPPPHSLASGLRLSAQPLTGQSHCTSMSPGNGCGTCQGRAGRLRHSLTPTRRAQLSDCRL